MSSAAVQQQSPPQQYSPTAGLDRYAVNPVPTSSSPSSRRAGKQSSGNASIPSTPQQPVYASPPGSAAMSSSRDQSMLSSSSHASPSQPLSNSTYQQFYPDSVGSGPAAALPIRTSSQQAPTFNNASPQDNRAYGGGSQTASSGYVSGSDNERRQRAQKSPGESGHRVQGPRPGGPVQSRSSTAVGQLPVDASLPRENSAIITHIVVDDPQADIARERARVAESRPNQQGAIMPDMVDQTIPADPDQKQRSRQEHLKAPSHRKEVKFGDYILGQTLGEGEFGKVKMGWKRDSTIQVAIKLIKKESLQGNANRLPKIYREIAILRELQHPNIVRLHEFVETERHMGIILEYASGGELFDYILNNRYLKDPSARRLFAQLVSGVGYLHRKGIVHRDLKLENLLLDRNKNIIITDFGFANTFNPNDELGADVEKRLNDKEFVKREHLGDVNDQGMRRGDLMQTSCGSPCYAAPELVVSDGLYTGRKVDVWSCGVILYAMLAGYLPFDDDPANPEGDNINLLYKYITSTALTFPEYVTPHARDLLRRILVPNPRSRADLFEVARHSWLSEYTHLVGFIGSSTKSDLDIAQSAMQHGEEPSLGRSASVREPTSRSPRSADEAQKQPEKAEDAAADSRNATRDAKRRTVQLEYVPPLDASQRVETVSAAAAAAAVPIVATARTRARGDGQGPVEVQQPTGRRDPQTARREVPSPSAMPPPTRPARDTARAASDFQQGSGPSTSRPNTSGTLGPRLPSRGNSYSQPAVATPTNANAQGHLSQPKPNSGYIISSPLQAEQTPNASRPGSQQNLAQFQQQDQQSGTRGHKRSSTLGSLGDRILGRSASRRASQQQQQQDAGATNEKKLRKYPPVSMRNAIPNNNDEAQPRQSTDSGRRPSFGFNRKPSDLPSEKRSSRRFSFLPGSFSMNNFTGSRQSGQQEGRPESKGMAFGRGQSRTPSESTTNSAAPQYFDANRNYGRDQRSAGAAPQVPRDPRFEKPLPAQPPSSAGAYPSPPPIQRKQYRDDGYGNNALEQPPSRQGQDPYYAPADNSARMQSPPSSSQQQRHDQYPSALPQSSSGYSSYDYAPAPEPQMRPNQRKFNEQYEHGNSGSSSATRRVMDFFRRRGKDRSEG